MKSAWSFPYLLLMAVLFSCGNTDQVSGQEATPAEHTDKTIVCFLYHRFGDDNFPSTNITLADFEFHLRYLNSHGYSVLTLSDAMEDLVSGNPATKTAVITVDDGYRSFYERALPLLKKYNMPATLFVNTETVGAPDYMGWEELESAKRAGVEIGNHTHSHSYYLNLEAGTRYRAFEEDIRKSKEILFDKLGISPKVFAYPYGEFDASMKRVVMQSGFQYAAAQNSGVIYSGTDAYQIPRFPMSEAYADSARFIEKANMLPLKVIRQVPDDTIPPQGETRPSIQITFHKDDLVTNRLQCFVQGGKCAWKVVDNKDDKVTIEVQSVTSISSRRRTLYTVTVPDNTGAWHWYSHLWISSK